MKTSSLNAALIAAGVLAVGTAGAFTLRPDLLDKARAGLQPAQPATTQAAGDVQVAALTATAAPAPVPMVAGNGLVPNYRAIVQQFGPAVSVHIACGDPVGRRGEKRPSPALTVFHPDAALGRPDPD